MLKKSEFIKYRKIEKGSCDICNKKEVDLKGYISVSGNAFNGNYGYCIRMCSQECHNQWKLEGSKTY